MRTHAAIHTRRPLATELTSSAGSSPPLLIIGPAVPFVVLMIHSAHAGPTTTLPLARPCSRYLIAAGISVNG